jgi:hypothetical protein
LATKNWEVLPQPLYSPALAASDYHLFQDLQNYFDSKKSATTQGLFTSKLTEFFKRTEKMIDRWHIVNSSEKYITD